MEEIVVQEMRAVRLDLAARVPFTKDGELIQETREEFERLAYPEQASASVMEDMADTGMIEWGE
jgi:hypothetical protein